MSQTQQREVNAASLMVHQGNDLSPLKIVQSKDNKQINDASEANEVAEN